MATGVSVRPVKRVTIYAVAQRAGVSIGTVSLALNGSRRCSPVTAQRVRDAAAQLGYLPNHAAKSLRRQTSETVALVIPDIGNPVYVAMAKVAQQIAKERGYHLSLISTNAQDNEEIYALETLARRRVDGLIFCSLKMTAQLLAALQQAQGPICVIGPLPTDAGIDNVQVNSEYGVQLAIDHLVSGGRRRLAMLNGPRDTVPARVRGSGYLKALERHQLGAQAGAVFHTEFSRAGGYAAVDALLSQRPDLDALFCANDLIALGAMQRLRERGRRIPQEVAVVGMDDIQEGTLGTPTLTSVSLLAGERGQLAAELLFDRLLEQAPPTPKLITVMPRLVVRESSGLPHSNTLSIGAAS